MYKHMLLATDGSKLSNKAVVHAINLAQSLGARLTAFYASPGYPTPMYAEGMVYDRIPKKEYETAMNQEASKVLDTVAAKAMAAGVEVHRRARYRGYAVGGHPRDCAQGQMRRDRDGLARAARHRRVAARQRNAESRHAQQVAGHRRPVASREAPRCGRSARRVHRCGNFRPNGNSRPRRDAGRARRLLSCPKAPLHSRTAGERSVMPVDCGPDSASSEDMTCPQTHREPRCA